MLQDRSKVGIALIIFYIPAVILAAYLLFRRHGRPRLGWYLLTAFSSVRFASGIVMIVFENNPTVGLTIATIILLSVGVVPLILATLGLLRVAFSLDFEQKHLVHRLAIFVRIIFGVAIALLIAGSVLVGNYKSPSSVRHGDGLVKAGNILLVAILAALIMLQAYIWRQRRGISRASMTIVKGSASAMPFLIVRVAYALLSVFSTSQKWNNLTGSIAAFVCMGLLMEYVVVGIYIGVGISIPPVGKDKLRDGDAHVVLTA
ncbi:hypothetical protein C8Q69DRAFT_499204 [Paecilomyces variotii]|uniref:DUF7702 domain-containing protein n=1 Tax=Byssochlamys spectabilis TaxID=264951 RepID=A0A443HRK9_BYSSP|nr:hypothetical protein C8Q69DRAFT_499204 [Paecilomyces variotii]KAJ9365594.1 hypothetical protein DTO280E4_563 [Paecilomyces variotii]RWQ94434.1 hypothetical protein C8Q69DRAFT_499204 [Paecilomyces variotii]